METYNKVYEELFERRKAEILNTEDAHTANGMIYYVSNDGDDQNDGCSEDSSWQTLDKVSEFLLQPGDAVLFKRGDLFRGHITAKEGVFYGAYGEGDKPKLYGSEFSLADPELWSIYDAEKNIWKCNRSVLDAGSLVFNDGEYCSLKLIPSYINGKFVCRDDESRDFDLRSEMKNDLDIYWHYDARFTEAPSRGENFPIPLIDEQAYGELYLRCDRGNPGDVFSNIESIARTHMFAVGDRKNVVVDNLCIKYVGMHGVSAGGHVIGLTVTNCEFGWIGGTIQHYYGTDPNYPEGGRGTVTRFGNAIEVYGGCENYTVENNYIYESYDAGITHQVNTTKKVVMDHVLYKNNVIEKCVYGIEYFLDQRNGEKESYMDHICMTGNFVRLSGYGWGQQRHNKHTPAHIKGWSYVNTAKEFVIEDNIFDRCAYQMLHLVALKKEYCPKLNGNTYIQYKDGMMGRYGANEVKEPEIIMVDENIEKSVSEIFGDFDAQIVIA